MLKSSRFWALALLGLVANSLLAEDSVAQSASRADSALKESPAPNAKPAIANSSAADQKANAEAAHDQERELRLSKNKARKFRKSQKQRKLKTKKKEKKTVKTHKGRELRHYHRRYRPVSYYTKRRDKYDRQHGCILTAEFGHFFYSLLTRSSEFTVRYFSNCVNIPEITYRIYYENHTFINWYHHPTEVYLNVFNNIYKLQFRKPKQINSYDITKALMYQEMSLWGMKKNPKPIDLNFDNQLWLQKQHIFGFEPNNIAKLGRQTSPLPCFVRRVMVKNWKKIIKKRLLVKKQKAKMMKMMMQMMAKKNGGGRQLSLLDDVPGMKGMINKKLFRSAGRVHLRREKIDSVKRNLRLVKRKHQNIGRSLGLINSGSPIARNLKAAKKPAKKPSKKSAKKPTKKSKKKPSKKGKKVKKKKGPTKQEKFMKLVKKVSAMKYKMNRALIIKKMKKKLIKGYYLVCASP